MKRQLFSAVVTVKGINVNVSLNFTMAVHGRNIIDARKVAEREIAATSFPAWAEVKVAAVVLA